MYYLRTKAAADAIKFTLDNSKKQEVPEIAELETTVVAPTVAKTIKVEATSTNPLEVDVQPMTAAEMKELIAKAKEGQADDDCLMCGS
jgi:ribonucleoside-diphosphate reductase alpha chain